MWIRTRPLLRSVLPATLVAGLLTLAPPVAEGHEIPADIRVLGFVKPEGGRLRILLRVPLRAMRDVEFPLRGPGYLDLASADIGLRDAVRLWIVSELELFEESTRLGPLRVVAARASLPSDRSFASYPTALAHVIGPPLAARTSLYWQQAMLDVLLEVPIRSQRSRFSIRPHFERLALHVVTALRFLPPDGGERAFQYVGDPGLVRLDPSWLQAALRFVRSGFSHIVDGLDHLLFLLCLVIPFRRLRTLVPIVTGFTAGHSLTLLGSALGVAPVGLWFPPLIETLIALSIVYMAFENIVGARVRRRWMLAFGFGLVHGFGFALALRATLQFAGRHLLTSLLAFNVGVELGQLAVLVVLVPVLNFVFRRVIEERLGTILLSALVAHTAWHWMSERGGVLLQYDLPGSAWWGLSRAGAVLGLALASSGVWLAVRFAKAVRARARVPTPLDRHASPPYATRHRDLEHRSPSPPGGSDDPCAPRPRDPDPGGVRQRAHGRGGVRPAARATEPLSRTRGPLGRAPRGT